MKAYVLARHRFDGNCASMFIDAVALANGDEKELILLEKLVAESDGFFHLYSMPEAELGEMIAYIKWANKNKQL